MPTRRRYEEFLDACSGCGAYCCKTLVFPHGRPSHRRNLDYLQFALGFPGVEVGVSDGEWQLVVRARCRHLTDDDRCGVYGSPERPSICRYYDASTCSYVVQFGQTRPRGFLRVRLEVSSGELVARIAANQASGAVTSFAEADALVLVPADRERIDEGDRLEAIRLAEI